MLCIPSEWLIRDSAKGGGLGLARGRRPPHAQHIDDFRGHLAGARGLSMQVFSLHHCAVLQSVRYGYHAHTIVETTFHGAESFLVSLLKA